MLGHVDVKVDRGVEDGEQVRDLAGLVDPGWPVHHQLDISSKKLTQVHYLTVSVPACFNSNRFGIHRTLWHTMKTEIKKIQGFIQK